MAELAGEHYDLPAVVRFMCDEVGQDVADVKRQIAPYIAWRRRDGVALVTAELQKFEHAVVRCAVER